ncbi:MAG: sirohydrochlorin chelatase [Ardenticatenia bacterium]|nr:sirohydrochlorin chelatase [Ardenticatenia bacterium]
MTNAPNALVLVGHGSRDPEGVAQYTHFARAVAARLNVAVYPCFLELADPPIASAPEQAVQGGATHVVVMPLFLGPAGHQKNDVPALLTWARATWPDVTFVYGVPLGPHGLIVEAMADRVRDAERSASSARVSPRETAVLVVGRGSRDPDSNSDVFKVARLLWEGRDYRWVEVAFYSLTGPSVAEGIERCARLGARRVIGPLLALHRRYSQGHCGPSPGGRRASSWCGGAHCRAPWNPRERAGRRGPAVSGGR